MNLEANKIEAYGPYFSCKKVKLGHIVKFYNGILLFTLCKRSVKLQKQLGKTIWLQAKI